MPHIILETTADLPENSEVPDILQALAEKLCSFESIDSKAVKAYHTLRSVWHMGVGAPAGFSHCTVCLLKGRPLELRKRISDALYAVMKEAFVQSVEAREVSLTLELREMDPDTYRKL